MFGGGGHGPDSTPTKAAFSKIGANLTKLCWTSSISAGVICLFIFFSSSRSLGRSVRTLVNGAIILVVRLRQIGRGVHQDEWVNGNGGGFPDGRFD
jgi:hypothetical protein